MEKTVNICKKDIRDYYVAAPSALPKTIRVPRIPRIAKVGGGVMGGGSGGRRVLPCDIMTQIVLYSGDKVAYNVLQKYVSPYTWKLMKERILLYGQVQSGKTAEIIRVVMDPLYLGIRKLVVIQNSILVLNQYRMRLLDAGIQFQVINKRTRDFHSPVLLLMNNKNLLNRYLSVAGGRSEEYIILMDEADMYFRHPLALGAIREYYITATPFHKKYDRYFHDVVKLKPAENYYGFDKVDIEFCDNETTAVRRFLSDGSGGMMLVNCYTRIQYMKSQAEYWTSMFPTIPIVVLCSRSYLYLDGVITMRKEKVITDIIDSLRDYPHIIFIANRLSMRGLSYVSSDYSRHLTCQYSDFRDTISVTNCLQKIRLFGKYDDMPVLKLILPCDNREKIEKIMDVVMNKDIMPLL